MKAADSQKQLPNPRPSKQLLARVRDWVEREVAFVDHPLFHETKSAEKLTSLRPASLDEAHQATKLEPGLAFVAGMVEMPLLSLDEERYLFAWMNFLKRRAERNRQRLSLNRPDEALVEQIESDLRDATATRNRIVQSNLRLVVALSKRLSAAKQAGALDQMSELISEGTLPLIRSVELFDVSLGNRFSTYATWAVRNQMFRFLKRRDSRIESVGGEDDLWTNRLVDDRGVPEDDERLAAQRGELVQRLLSQLSERERIVIASRFGLEGHPQGQSLNDIAQQLGLSKERVRQIVISSLEKLHEVANVSEIE
jgi:RNA polymerase sigma factor (sigma-70 family)